MSKTETTRHTKSDYTNRSTAASKSKKYHTAATFPYDTQQIKRKKIFFSKVTKKKTIPTWYDAWLYPELIYRFVNNVQCMDLVFIDVHQWFYNQSLNTALSNPWFKINPHRQIHRFYISASCPRSSLSIQPCSFQKNIYHQHPHEEFTAAPFRSLRSSYASRSFLFMRAARLWNPTRHGSLALGCDSPECCRW